MHDETCRILTDGFHHGIEHIIAGQLVFNYRIPAAHGLKTDALTQLSHVIDVVHPFHINHLEKRNTLDLPHVSACLGDLFLFCLVQRLGFIQKTLLEVLSTNAFLLFLGKNDLLQRNDGAKRII